MKNVDIDQIKNRQLYKMPEAFFDEIQEKVLKRTVYETETIPITQPKTPLKKWLFAAAACLAVISGSVLISQYNELQRSDVIPSYTTTEITPQVNVKALAKPDEGKTNILVENNSIEKSNQDQLEDASFNNKVHHNKKASHVPNDPSRVVEKQIVAKQGTMRKASTTEAKIDVLLASFSPEELALLAQNTEQDVYLDLYN